MKKVAIFVDHENIRIPAEKQNLEIDWYQFREYLASDAEGRSLSEAFIYVVRDPRSMKATEPLVTELWESGWIVREKERVAVAPNTYKGNVDIEMTMEMVSFAFDAKPDIIVLVSGDQDFIPVVLKLRERGIRVEVASFSETVSHRLINASSGFINLDNWTKEEECKEKEDIPQSNESTPTYDNCGCGEDYDAGKTLPESDADFYGNDCEETYGNDEEDDDEERTWRLPNPKSWLKRPRF